MHAAVLRQTSRALGHLAVEIDLAKLSALVQMELSIGEFTLLLLLSKIIAIEQVLTLGLRARIHSLRKESSQL